MTKRPQIRITLIDRKGPAGCHRGHTVGQSWDFDTQRGEICPMAMHTAFLYIDILRYGGSIPGQKPGQAIFSCPDADTLNIGSRSFRRRSSSKVFAHKAEPAALHA